MIVVVRLPCRDVVAQALIVPRVSVTLVVAKTSEALVLTFVATVRTPSAELPTRNGVNAAKAVRLAVRTTNADAVFEGVGNILQE